MTNDARGPSGSQSRKDGGNNSSCSRSHATRFSPSSNALISADGSGSLAFLGAPPTYDVGMSALTEVVVQALIALSNRAFVVFLVALVALSLALVIMLVV